MALPIALRGSDGICMVNGPPALKTEPPFQKETSSACKSMVFSKDGSVFGWCNGKCVKIVETKTYTQIQEIERPKTSMLAFSPKGTLIALWEPYTVDKETNAGIPNLHIYNVGTGQLLKDFIQKKPQFWTPQWTDDEHLCARNVNNELHFFENSNFDKIVNRLQIQKIAGYTLASAGPPYHVAGYVPGTKGQPSFVRVYRYPNFGGPNAALANRTFFKSDDVKMMWNKTGSAVLVLTTTETSESSYYGDQGLHYLGTNGEASLVHLGKNGPVYHVEWNPKGTEFCVVYGFMPAKATLYNTKAEPVFDFGTGPRNFGFFNPQGILCLCGFGNLRGNMEFWDLSRKKLISNPQSPDTTSFQWAADGEHILTATTAPRLRVGNGKIKFWDLLRKKLISYPQSPDTTSFQWAADREHIMTATTAPRLRFGNGYRIWHYSGAILEQVMTEKGLELWEAFWQPAPVEQFPEKPINYRVLESAVEGPIQEKKQAAYVPPSLRGQNRTTAKLHEYELPSNMKQAEANKPVSKNKKRRDAKKEKAMNDPKPAQPSEPRPEASSQSGPKPPVSITGDPEKDKEIKKLTKKLKDIDKLKEQQKAGKQLEKNQLEKIKTERDLQKQLEELKLG